MSLDDTTRARLLLAYAPRLVGAVDVTGVTGTAPTSPIDDLIEDIEDDLEELEEDLEELEDLVDPDSPDDPDEDDADEDDDPAGPAPTPVKRVVRAQVREREDARSSSDNAVSTATTDGIWKPVITSARGRTFLTAPATTEQASMWDAVPNPNRHLLWMQGRFVGGDRPNRNGAYWSSQDLEVGQPTVVHGPLNWLHQDQHVIGTIADARFVPNPGGGGLQVQPDSRPMPQQQAVERAAETQDPHIVALSAIWKWVYPEESSVVQMASDAGLLAYSMECVSEAVQCVGDGGCGEAFGYMAYAQGQTCGHLKERATVRRLVNPTFLGGAVIVPPARPGWADADARVMAAAADLAEKAFDQAGRPDIPASTWEQMMAGVVKYTEAQP